MHSLRGLLASVVVGVAAALVIVALAILPFLNPLWVGFEQGRADALAWTGFSQAQLTAVTDSVLSDLIVGPPTFDVTVDGQPVLDPRERQHMADVRGVFVGFFVVAIAAAVVLAAAFMLARDRAARARLWRRLSRAGAAIIVVTIAVGVLGLLFFEQAFEVFHTLFFPAGSYDFDPATEKLVQLFPFDFWLETTVAVVVVIVGLSALLWWGGGRRASRLEATA
jgi:integral membrane protein (TIGR01906 family)